jgi:hypothetical protein
MSTVCTGDRAIAVIEYGRSAIIAISPMKAPGPASPNLTVTIVTEEIDQPIEHQECRQPLAALRNQVFARREIVALG